MRQVWTCLKEKRTININKTDHHNHVFVARAPLQKVFDQKAGVDAPPEKITINMNAIERSGICKCYHFAAASEVNKNNAVSILSVIKSYTRCNTINHQENDIHFEYIL